MPDSTVPNVTTRTDAGEAPVEVTTHINSAPVKGFAMVSTGTTTRTDAGQAPVSTEKWVSIPTEA